MKKCKITVLKTMLNEDLAKEYGVEGLEKCPFHNVGQIFHADYAKPEGFCDEALESHLSICICIITWRQQGNILLWRLDKGTRGGNL
jgi:uncharacterized repeat protein (TIGR04076 family)